ncbi:dihydroorotate dehydrogenase electron transfer subunit [Hoylesella buccalis]|uniref:Diguanylate cyclase n=1 Tax=Hoylesella buccalis DNF00853 TaxID=1401074 RepID=A0A095ZI04_9BACT|nr:dihydroorotate dehydrogenase electron transfer subunit [Hoylesella buccalis]KGF34303.1 diguanylate cyclase [Hoylesella buccalis DNF00853]
MRKICEDYLVQATEQLSDRHWLMRLRSSSALPEMHPGQFVQVHIDDSPSTYLRRPISINMVDYERNEILLLVAAIGEGTRHLVRKKPGEKVNCLLPLGNSFTMPRSTDEHVLLVGGGVGIAPMLFLGKRLVEMGVHPTFLLGARTADELLEKDMFSELGDLYLTTEDGSEGEKGYVTNHSILKEKRFDRIATCGPKPMMMSVARYAKQNDIECEVSLENDMACGLGACLCCVEDTTDGHICVCTEGPVLNIKKLLWQL